MHWRKATPTTEMTMGLKIAAAVQKRNCSGQLTSNFCSAFSSCQKCHSGFRNNQEKSKEWKIKYYLPSVLLEERERATARRIRGVEWHTWMRKKGWGRDKRVLEGLSKDVHEKMKWERGSNSLKSRRQTLKFLASEIKPFQRSLCWAQQQHLLLKDTVAEKDPEQQLNKWEMSNKPGPVGSWELCGQI